LSECVGRALLRGLSRFASEPHRTSDRAPRKPGRNARCAIQFSKSGPALVSLAGKLGPTRRSVARASPKGFVPERASQYITLPLERQRLFCRSKKSGWGPPPHAITRYKDIGYGS
jgi:hypothetical protein